MSATLEPYLPVNPFVDLSVGEAEMWGTRSWLDVPEIHAAAFEQLRMCVELVRSNGRTQVRFVRGMGGSGKSHLFARVRRQLGDSVFYAYASNPPLQRDALEAFLLGKIVGGLRHKARLADGTEAPFSQLRLLAYALLRPVIEQSLTFEEMHEAWNAVKPEERKDILHGAMLMLEAEHPQVPRGVLRTLLSVLRDEKENLAAQWLAGTTYLTDADLRFLGEPEPLVRELHGMVIHLLGRLASNASRPFVLVLDQLDLVHSAEMLSEFQRMLFALIDQSANWCVMVGLIGDRLRFWQEGLSPAMLGRVGIPDMERPELTRLPVIDVGPIHLEDKQTLIRRRLASPSLRRQREMDGIESDIFPLRDEDIAALTQGGPVYARHLLAACSERFARAVLPASSSSHVPLQEKVEAVLAEAIDHAEPETPYLGAVEIGERVRELVELLAEPRVKMEPGELQGLTGEFEGTDHVFRADSRHARVITCDVTRRSFIAVMEHLQAENGHTLLIRGTATGSLGQVAQELFSRFQLRNHFLQISAEETATLAGLGAMLAALREGHYDQLLTDPPVTNDAILDCLRLSQRLRATQVWAAVQAAFAGKPDAPELAEMKLPEPIVTDFTLNPGGTSLSASASPETPAPKALNGYHQATINPLPSHTEEALAVILATERWIEINRLHRRLQEAGCPCSLEDLRYALRTSRLAANVMVHPQEMMLAGGGPQIVLWHDSVD